MKITGNRVSGKTWMHPKFHDMLQKYSDGKLRACPFCGKKEFLLLHSTNENAFWVECDQEYVGDLTQGCGAKMSTGDTPDEAINNWNMRP